MIIEYPLLEDHASFLLSQDIKKGLFSVIGTALIF